MRILVTGVRGFLGNALVRISSNSGHEILGFTRQRGAFDNGSEILSFHQCDLEDSATYRKEVHHFAPEVLIHLAWKGIPDFSMVNCLSNLNMSVELANIVIETGTCKKILVAGSCFEFDQSFGPCLESNRGNPKDSFTWAKHSLFSYLGMACQNSNIKLGWMRAFYIYGPNQRAGSLIPTVFRALKDRTLPDLRTPKNSNDFVYVDDVARAFALAVEQEFPSGIYNLGSGVATSVEDICGIAEKMVTGHQGLTDKLRFKTKQTTQVSNFWADCTRSKKYLGWHATTSLVDGMHRYWKSVS